MGEPTLLMRVKSLVWRIEWKLLRWPHPVWCDGEWLEDAIFGDAYCSECGIYREWPG